MFNCLPCQPGSPKSLSVVTSLASTMRLRSTFRASSAHVCGIKPDVSAMDSVMVATWLTSYVCGVGVLAVSHTWGATARLNDFHFSGIDRAQQVHAVGLVKLGFERRVKVLVGCDDQRAVHTRRVRAADCSGLGRGRLRLRRRLL